jgi:MotA/TolQ/ExbB proton channel family
MQAFLRWWLIVCLMAFGAFGLFQFGYLTYLFETDQSSISVIILSMFALLTSWIGWLTYSDNKGIPPTETHINTAYFYADAMTALGLIGTIVGLILILGPAFANINVSDPATIEGAIKLMTTGMGTALLTTLTGSICSLLAKLQIINFYGKA